MYSGNVNVVSTGALSGWPAEVLMEELLTAVYEFYLPEDIKKRTTQISTEQLWKPDENGLDVMHHAVLSGHDGAIALLNELVTVLVKDPSVSVKPKGYLHLACLLGRESVAGLICNCPDVGLLLGSESVTWPSLDVIRKCVDNSKRLPLNAKQIETVEKVYCRIQERAVNEPPLQALDVAAMAGHVGCVNAILNSHLVRRCANQSSCLERALHLGSLHAFRLLLAQNPRPEAVDHALQIALARKLPEFVAALLDFGADFKRALDGTNPFHFIYLCSPLFYSRPVYAIVHRHIHGIDKLTALLIERGFDVNHADPPGTFPLYSLLASLIQEKDYNPSKVPTGRINALGIMLRAHAQTDKNELKFLSKNDVSPADISALSVDAGRELATSALNAFFVGLQSSDTWRVHMAEHLDRICLTLLEHGASAAGSDDVPSLPLHDLMRATATQHVIGHMHADLSTMSRMLLYFGADPNRLNSVSQYPIVCYFSQLLGNTGMGGLIAYRRWKGTDNAAQVTCRFKKCFIKQLFVTYKQTLFVVRFFMYTRLFSAC